MEGQKQTKERKIMKQVIIIYRKRENLNAVNFIKQDLETVFGHHVLFENFFLCDLKEGMQLTADAFLALGEDVFYRVKDHVEDFSRIIKMNRSPERSALNMISKIPANTSVLVVNDTYASSIDTVNSFYEVGISHINMIPFDEELEHTGIYDRFQIAITPGETALVPHHIQKVIDIGYRRVSFDTMFKLKNMLELDVALIDRNIYRHIYTILEPDTAFHANYIYGFLKSEMLSHMANSAKMGLILADNNYQPVYINDRAAEIFHCSNKAHLHIEEYIDEQILKNEDLTETTLEIFQNRYNYSRHVITLMDEVIGHYIILTEKNEPESASKKKGLFAKYQFRDIVYCSACMDEVIRTSRQIALTDHTVLIRGESGTGKELIAQSIHNASHRSKYPFVAVNCAALPDSLLESELFGYEKGAFTGAASKGQVGLFEQANHGTIFLDEIGDISPKLQLRLLRTIQERQIMRIGSDRVIDIDVRFITATNCDLEASVKRGDFRNDLFFRLNVLPVVIPPLRERKEDIPLLLEHFLGDRYQSITPQEQTALMNYDWPGNVRELENTATYVLTLSKLPGYLFKKTIKGEARKFSADSTDDLLLWIIQQHETVSHGVGRPLMLRELALQGYTVSDVRLRKMLKDMQDAGYIDIARGRGGTRITEKGKTHLTRLQKE